MRAVATPPSLPASIDVYSARFPNNIYVPKITKLSIYKPVLASMRGRVLSLTRGASEVHVNKSWCALLKKLQRFGNKAGII